MFPDIVAMFPLFNGEREESERLNAIIKQAKKEAGELYYLILFYRIQKAINILERIEKRLKSRKSILELASMNHGLPEEAGDD